MKYCFILLLVSAAWAQTNITAGKADIANAGNFTDGQIHDYLSVFLNGYTEAGNVSTINAISTGIVVPTGTINNPNGISTRVYDYCNSFSRSVCDATGGYFVAEAKGTGAGVWGINPIAFDDPGVVGAQIQGGEFDIGISGTPTFVRGIAVIGVNPGTAPVDSIGYEVTKGTATWQWNRGAQIDDGCCSFAALEIGATAASGVSLASMPLTFARFDSSNVRHVDETINADSVGNLAVNTTGGQSLIVGNQTLTHLMFNFSGGQHILTHVANNDLAGFCTAASATTCTVTFTTAYTAAPVCTANDTSAVVTVQPTATTTQLVITTSGSTSDKFSYICIGNPN
jgi:hypothetical protein